MTIDREITEAPMAQGVDEEIPYSLTTTPWGVSPTSISVKVYDVTTGGRTDVTSTVMPVNTPTATGDVISLSPLKLLTANSIYRVEVKFTCSGNVFEAYAIVKAEY